jgi:hypothetical protein
VFRGKYFVRLGADEAVAGKALASLHAFQEKRKVSAPYFQERGYGRFQVGDDLPSLLYFLTSSREG